MIADCRRRPRGLATGLWRCRMRRNSRYRLAGPALPLVVCAAFTTPVMAQAAPPEPSQWHFAVVVYGYLPEIGGSATFPTGTTADITVDPNQIIRNLNFAFMGAFEARYGRFGAFTDLCTSTRGVRRRPHIP